MAIKNNEEIMAKNHRHETSAKESEISMAKINNETGSSGEKRYVLKIGSAKMNHGIASAKAWRHHGVKMASAWRNHKRNERKQWRKESAKIMKMKRNGNNGVSKLKYQWR
jgi:hypothetical protein